MTLWYLSFASESGFLGATIVEATDAKSAHAVATMRGLNPGGEIMMLEVPRDKESLQSVRTMINRLVSKSEMKALGGERVGDLSPKQRHWLNHATSCMCEACNRKETLQ